MLRRNNMPVTMEVKDDGSTEVNSNGQESFPGVINLNVGGKIFATRLSTLQSFPDSMLAAMFSGRHHLDQDSMGNYFIDRDGTHFSFILNYIRNGEIPPPEFAEAVHREGIYYGLDSLVDQLKLSPQVFADHILKSNIRNNFHNYEEIRRNIASLARQRATEEFGTMSSVLIVVTENRKYTVNIRFPNRPVRKHPSFESSFGKYYVHVPVENFIGVQNIISFIRCLLSDLNREGIKAIAEEQSITYDQIKVFGYSDDDIRVLRGIYNIQIDWLASEDVTMKIHPHQPVVDNCLL